MSPDCIYPPRKEERGGSLALASCKEWVQILVWLPEKRAERGCCKWRRRRCLVKKRTLRTTRRKRRKSRTGRKKPYMESLLGKRQVAGEEFWRWFRNDFIKKGNRTDPRRLRTSFRSKFCQAQHRYDKTSKTPICRFCGDSTERVWHIVSAWRKFAQRDNRNGEVRIT